MDAPSYTNRKELSRYHVNIYVKYSEKGRVFLAESKKGDGANAGCAPFNKGT
jgi:hypothetical protein